jgi:hypothetical protein
MAMLTPPPIAITKIADSEGRPSQDMIGWMNAIDQLLSKGFTGTIITAAITGAGATGSMEFENGVLINEVAAT